RMNRFVNRTPRFAAKHVQPGRGETFEQTSLGQRPSRLTTAIHHLVQIIDTNCVMRRRSFKAPAPLRFILRIRETPGIDDQRPPVCRDFDVQQIVMTMTTVSDWTTVENEVSLVLKARIARSPAAALNEVATITKIRTRRCGRGALLAGR